MFEQILVKGKHLHIKNDNSKVNNIEKKNGKAQKM